MSGAGEEGGLRTAPARTSGPLICQGRADGTRVIDSDPQPLGALPQFVSPSVGYSQFVEQPLAAGHHCHAPAFTITYDHGATRNRS
ncbi:hypothetical protein TPA0906_74690 [Streptomyces olivaceus]|nr:hypothetical protein TPA0906_74690 [Streptomyces olivaceus]